MRGFYTGIKVDLIRVLPANSILFVVYEMMKQHFIEKGHIV
jgi:hypothetical protein